jgi:hypothetical protein
MRTLAAALRTKQQSSNRTPYLRISFDNRAGYVAVFTTFDIPHRIVSVEQWEEPFAGVTVVRLSNYDQALSTVDFRGYSVVVGWGYALDTTPDATWYSNAATMKVIQQRDISYEGELITEFFCVAIWAEIEADYIFEGGKKIIGTVAGTFKQAELVTGSVSGATGRLSDMSGTFILLTRTTGTFKTTAPWDVLTGGTSGATCTQTSAATDNFGKLVYASGETTTRARIQALIGFTATTDTDDPDGSMADSPYLAVDIGTSVRDVIGRMLLRTKCGARYGNDGILHILYLNTATASQYSFDGTHAFLEDLRNKAIILPNTVYFVDALPGEGVAATYIGTANDAISVARIGTYVAPIQVDLDIISSAEGDTRAAAWIAQKVSQAYQGKITAQMECGLEVYDMVQAVDARLGVTSKGRIGRVERSFIPAENVYKVVMTLGSLYSEPSSMEPGVLGPDTGALVTGLDKNPPKLLPPSAYILPKGAQAYIADIKFTSTAYNAISWIAGSVKFADGTSQTVNAGTLTLTATHYLYVIYGNAVLQSSTSSANAVGDDRVMVGVASIGSTTTQLAYVLNPFGASIIVNRDAVMDALVNDLKLAANAVTEAKIAANAVTQGKIAALSIVGGHIQALQISAGHINTGAITADKISAGAVTAIKIDAAAIDATKLAAVITLSTIIYAGGGNVVLSSSGVIVKGGVGYFTLQDGGYNTQLYQSGKVATIFLPVSATGSSLDIVNTIVGNNLLSLKPYYLDGSTVISWIDAPFNPLRLSGAGGVLVDKLLLNSGSAARLRIPVGTNMYG